VRPLPETPDRGRRARNHRRVNFQSRSTLVSSSRRFAPARVMSKYLAIFAILLFCQLAAAQFGNFFEQMFQGEHPGRQQRQRPPGADHWRAQADASKSSPAFAQETFLIYSLLPVPCSAYLCPDTLVCVDAPPQCPCPNVEDIKCIIPDAHDKTAGTVICVRAGGCEDVDDYMNAWP